MCVQQDLAFAMLEEAYNFSKSENCSFKCKIKLHKLEKSLNKLKMNTRDFRVVLISMSGVRVHNTVATLLPVCIIITTLTFLNLDKVAFDFMGGINRETPHDAAYTFLFYLIVISTMIVIPLLIGYIVAIITRWKLLNKNRT